jgi:hypothetical protein
MPSTRPRRASPGPASRRPEGRQPGPQAGCGMRHRPEADRQWSPPRPAAISRLRPPPVSRSGRIHRSAPRVSSLLGAHALLNRGHEVGRRGRSPTRPSRASRSATGAATCTRADDRRPGDRELDHNAKRFLDEIGDSRRRRGTPPTWSTAITIARIHQFGNGYHVFPIFLLS